jgi:D-xylose reductase
MPVPAIKLSSGYDMPQVGFGLWKVDNEIAADTVYNAIKIGYRLFDGACGKSPSIEPLQRIAHVLQTQHCHGERSIYL